MQHHIHKMDKYDVRNDHTHTMALLSVRFAGTNVINRELRKQNADILQTLFSCRKNWIKCWPIWDSVVSYCCVPQYCVVKVI